MPTRDIQACLRDQVLVFDGAMGTEIYRRSVFTNRCFDELCLSQPDLIREIHRAYTEAGADVLTTNSFGANRFCLAKYGFAEKVAEINRAAAVLARETANSVAVPPFVAGSIGPSNAPALPAEQRVAMLAEQGAALAAGGVDFLVFETLPSREAGLEAVAAMAQLAPALPFILSFVVYEDGETAAGQSLESLLAPLPAHLPSPVALGLNCGVGPDGLLGAVERAVKLTPLPLVVQPNAGLPRQVENRQLYLCSPEYLTSYARRFVELGVHAVGGCCGTTPEHILDLARTIKPLHRTRVEISVSAPVAAGVTEKAEVPLAEKSRLGWRLANRQWVTTVELLPPRGYNLADVVGKAALCQRSGVDAVNIPDGPRASARLSPLVTALKIQQDARIDTILHVCCRDKNLISLQAELLGCAACGVRNLLCITGDPPKLGQYAFASGVFDADSIGLVALQHRLNRGVDLGGQPVDPATAAVIGVGADPNALDFDKEVQRFRRKIEAGADFAITQPVFAVEPLFRFLDAVQDLGIPVVAGIWPFASLRNAQFMKNEVPGVVVPDALIARMAAVSSKDDQRQVGIDIAREAVARARDRVAGIQVSAPLGNVQTALAVCQ